MGCCLSRPTQFDSEFTEDDVFRIVMFGGIGAGKSTFTQAMCGIESGVVAGGARSTRGGSRGRNRNRGHTQHIAAYFVKREICKRIGVKKACVIDVPGTGDAGTETCLAKLIAKLEAALKAQPVHAIILVNQANQGRMHIAIEIASILLEISFIQAAEQIIAVMTKCDKETKYTREENREMWRDDLKHRFGKKSKIPIVMCGIPVNEREHTVIGTDEYERMYKKPWGDTPTIEPTIMALARLAKHPRVVQYVQAESEKVLSEVSKACGIPIDHMQEQIKDLELERDAKEEELAQVREDFEARESRYEEMIREMEQREKARKWLPKEGDDLVCRYTTEYNGHEWKAGDVYRVDELDIDEMQFKAWLIGSERGDWDYTNKYNLWFKLSDSYTKRFRWRSNWESRKWLDDNAPERDSLWKCSTDHETEWNKQTLKWKKGWKYKVIAVHPEEMSILLSAFQCNSELPEGKAYYSVKVGSNNFPIRPLCLFEEIPPDSDWYRGLKTVAGGLSVGLPVTAAVMGATITAPLAVGFGASALAMGASGAVGSGVGYASRELYHTVV